MPAIIIDNITQGTPEWFREHAGKPGASSFNKIVTTKGEPSKQAKDYALQLAGEYLLGTVEQGYISHAMQIGIEREEEARNRFEWERDIEVKQVGMVYLDERKDRLCSPDGLIYETDSIEGFECKCPILKTHIKYLLDGKLPTEYYTQVQGSLYITGVSYWWFMSYYPGLEPLIIRVERNEKFIEKLDKALDDFCFEIVKIIKKLIVK